MFCTRSEYFRALLEDHFSEAVTDKDSSLPIVPLNNLNSETFTVIVVHVYSGLSQSFLTPEVVYDVLEAADMFLLADLKRGCGLYLSGHLMDAASAVDMVMTARLYDIPKLEQSAVEFMAGSIEASLLCVITVICLLQPRASK